MYLTVGEFEKKININISDIERYIEIFDKINGFLIKRVRLDKALSLKILQNIYHIRSDDPMILGFDVNEHQAKVLEQYVDFYFNFEKYTYQLTTDFG